MVWGGRRKAQERGDIWVFMADSCCCKTETNTTQQSNYPPMKSRLRNNKMDNHHNKKLWYCTCFQSNVADSEILINVNILSFLQAFQLLYWMCWYFHLKVGNTNKNKNKFKVWTSVFFWKFAVSWKFLIWKIILIATDYKFIYRFT